MHCSPILVELNILSNLIIFHGTTGYSNNFQKEREEVLTSFSKYHGRQFLHEYQCFIFKCIYIGIPIYRTTGRLGFSPGHSESSEIVITRKLFH